MNQDRGGNAVTFLTLAIVLAILLGGWLAFPRIQAYLDRQDCIGTGRVNCG